MAEEQVVKEEVKASKAMIAYVKSLNGSVSDVSTISANFDNKTRVHPLASLPADQRRFTLNLTWQEDEIEEVASLFESFITAQMRINMQMSKDRFTRWTEMTHGCTVNMPASTLYEKAERKANPEKKAAKKALDAAEMQALGDFKAKRIDRKTVQDRLFDIMIKKDELEEKYK